MLRKTSLIVLQHLFLLTHAAFDMSVFNRMELKICHSHNVVLDCPDDQLLWVHEALLGTNPFVVEDKDTNLHICAADAQDCRKTFSGTEVIFRATSIRPYHIKPMGRIRCLYNVLSVGITYMLIHYSCIQEIRLDPISMLSSLSRVTNTAHIQLLPGSLGDNGTMGVEVMCRMEANEHHTNGITATLTLVYIDLPTTSPCSQRLWAKDQDGMQLFSFCSPTWRRQHTVYGGRVSWVALHFKSQPILSDVRRTVSHTLNSAPSLFIWIYFQAGESFTVACGQNPGSHGVMSTTSHPFTTPPTQSSQPSRSTTTTPAHDVETVPDPITSHTREPPSSTPATSPHDVAAISQPPASQSPPTASSTTRVISNHSNGTVSSKPSTRHPPPLPNYTTSTSLGAEPGTSGSSSLPIPSSAPPTPITRTSTHRELSAGPPLYRTDTTTERNPHTPQHAALEYGTTEKGSSLEIAAISMGVVITILLVGFAMIAARWGKTAWRRAQLRREQEMLYYPNGFDGPLPNPLDDHNPVALAADVPNRPGEEEDLPGLTSAEGAVGGDIPMWVSGGSNLDTSSNISDPSYASLHI